MSPRLRLSLDGQWNFWTDPNASQSLSALNAQSAVRITVPAPWQADANLRDYTGIAWYQREIDIPEEWFASGRVILLGFGAVDYFAEVWLNDIKVGEHEGGYLPFELDVTEAVRSGENTLTVRVNDPLEIFSEIPHGKQSWYGMLSGIWQTVWVESRPATHIQRVKITPSADSVDIVVTLSRPLPSDKTLDIEILAPDGTLVAQAETSSLNYQLRITDSQLWDIDSPNLYTINVSIPADEVWETFGFRTIETKDGQILLNGRPFYMRAALDQDYYPELISTPPSQEYIEDQFHKAKEMGLNCLRVHIKIADPRYYAAADKVGLLIWTELPNHILLSDEAKRRARETLAGMLERDWNHPSIGIWTIINESWGIDLTDAFQRAWLAETYDWFKSLDPTRLVVGNSACWGNFHVVTDIADFHIYYAMPDHFRQWRDWTENYAHRPAWLFAHEYKDIEAWRDFTRNPWHTDERPFAFEVKQNGDEPLVVSEFGNWGLPDVTKLYEGNNGAAPWWFDTGLEWGDGVVYPRGIEQRFKDYHLDKVFPSLSALTEASQRLQFEALKYEIEQMRRYDSIQGYVITEFTDVHWESNGLLDMYRNPKIYHARLKEINADDMLILLWEQLPFSMGNMCLMKVLLSHYSTLEIKDAVLEWEVLINQSSVISKQLTVDECAPFGVTEVGIINFDIPQVEHPTKAQLELRLISGEILIASTQQEFYIFPYDSPVKLREERGQLKQGERIYSTEFGHALDLLGYDCTVDLSEADIAVVSTLDDTCREFLLRGGKVLLLAEKDDAVQTYIPRIEIEPRHGTPCQGDWASSFGWHRFDALPTGNVINFAFADLTPEHIIHGFAPRDFALDVYAGLFVGWLHKPIPTIARRHVGRGTLLISTFRLAQNLEANPLARCLLAELMMLVKV
ncbi:MAG: glycoside hydrolase family 2 [Chloroflexota bacterium]|nr:glycoside hydrolase family 2 [Chloroflexota bacterium]